MRPADVLALCVSMMSLLAAAHVLGALATRIRQPRVIGEVIGGMLLGPNVLGVIWPGAREASLVHGDVPAVLAALQQLGMWLLMFASGAEMRTKLATGERRTVAFIVVIGTVFPFLAGMALPRLIDATSLAGRNANEMSLALVFGVAVAVTSIPVISRILMDLGVLDTAFARIVLAAAVIEDVLLYVVLSVALGLAGDAQGVIGVPALLGLSNDLSGAAYHVVAAAVFFGVCFVSGPRFYARTATLPGNLLHRASPMGGMLVFLLGVTSLAVLVGVAPMFGAFAAGVVVGRDDDAEEARTSIKTFALAFFVPLYFAIVGLRLHFTSAFSVATFLALFTYACAAKATAVYAGARAAGEGHTSSVNLAAAMNARGGPGIVLATAALDAGLVQATGYAMLVLLSLGTSSLAGSHLSRALERDGGLR